MGMMGLVLSFCDAQIALMKNSGVIPIKPATPELNGDAAQNSGGGGVGGLSDYTIGVAIPSSTLSRIGSVGSFAGTLAQRATVLYDHDAQEALEVSVREGDEVTIVKGENDGWITVRKRDGAEGMIPATYAKMLESTLHLPVASSMLNSALSMGSFSSTIPATTGAVIPPLQAVYGKKEPNVAYYIFFTGFPLFC